MGFRIMSSYARTCVNYQDCTVEPACKVGIPYSRVRVAKDPMRPDGPTLLPCFRDDSGRSCDTCPKQQFPTQNQVKKHDAKSLRAFEGSIAAIVKIRTLAKGRKGVRGKTRCPACGGSLRFEIHSNGHIWARCKTPDCVNFLS